MTSPDPKPMDPERLRNTSGQLDDYTRGLIDARRAFAKVWADVTRNEISVLDFTPDRLSTELRSRWLERRSLADGTVPAVGQRVVTVREVAERWGLSHGHDDHVHEITLVLGDCHLVECGPRQIGMAMLRLAPAGSDVTCPHCRGWHDQREQWTIDARVYRETQLKVAELGKRAADAERDRDDARAEIEVLIGAARKVTGASADEEPEDVARHLVTLCEQLENADKVAVDLWVAEQRVKDIEAERDALQAEVTRLRARVRVEAEDVVRAGLVDATVLNYLLDRGWTLGHRYRRGGHDLVVVCLDGEPIAALTESGGRNSEYPIGTSIAFVVGRLAKHEGRCPWAILDEMAAMPLEPDQ